MALTKHRLTIRAQDYFRLVSEVALAHGISGGGSADRVKALDPSVVEVTTSLSIGQVSLHFNNDEDAVAFKLKWL